MRFLLPLLFIFPLLADEMALSVDEAFPDPYGCYNDPDCGDCYADECYDADLDETWYWDEESPPIYPGRNSDEWMDELTKPW